MAKLSPTSSVCMGSVLVDSVSRQSTLDDLISPTSADMASGVSTNRYVWGTSLYVSNEGVSNSDGAVPSDDIAGLFCSTSVCTLLNKSGCTTVLCTALVFVGSEPVMRCKRVLNSSSSNRDFNLSISGCFRLRISRSNCIGTSVLIVTNNREKRIPSALSSTFFLMLPDSSDERSSSCPIPPNRVISLTAVFSPTPGHPGTLSAVSPISPSRSITCRGDCMPYLSHTSLGPSMSKPALPCCGRHIMTLSLTNCA